MRRSMKTASSSPNEQRSFAPVLVAIALVVLGFLVAAVYTELRATAIDRETEQLESNAIPSVEYLAAAREALWRLEIAADDYVDEPGERHPEADIAMQIARQELDRELATEFATGPYPGEAEIQLDATRALGRIDRLIAHLREADAGKPPEDRASVRREVRASFEQADAVIHRLLSLNAAEGRSEARRITNIRASAVRWSFWLNLACITLSVVAAGGAVRALGRQHDLERLHKSLLEARATELEGFASRVAHDFLSPLSALHFTLTSLKRNVEKGLPVSEPIERAEACLKRSRTLVDGVMDFARSGASPGPGRADLRATLDGVLEEVRHEAGDVELLVAGRDERVTVACSAGILASILSNLVHNAVKYMGDRPEKRVTIRAATLGAVVRVEVEDTGPGLAPELEPHVFEAYVRAVGDTRPGLGLGLATVKRFVESHGGRVGVDSSPEHGCCFWFEMPRAEAAPLP